MRRELGAITMDIHVSDIEPIALEEVSAETDSLLNNVLERLGGQELQTKSIKLNDKRTSIKLTPSSWVALFKICDWEQLSIDQLIVLILASKHQEVSLGTAVKTFIILYYRELS